MTITMINYLDFGNILINELFGSVFLFLLVGLIVITYYCITRRIPLQVMLMLDFIFIAATMSYEYLSSVWALVIIVLGLLGYVVYDKFWRR